MRAIPVARRPQADVLGDQHQRPTLAVRVEANVAVVGYAAAGLVDGLLAALVAFAPHSSL
jgi:hypothetical protein